MSHSAILVEFLRARGLPRTFINPTKGQSQMYTTDMLLDAVPRVLASESAKSNHDLARQALAVLAERAAKRKSSHVHKSMHVHTPEKRARASKKRALPVSASTHVPLQKRPKPGSGKRPVALPRLQPGDRVVKRNKQFAPRASKVAKWRENARTARTAKSMIVVLDKTQKYADARRIAKYLKYMKRTTDTNNSQLVNKPPYYLTASNIYRVHELTGRVFDHNGKTDEMYITKRQNRKSR